MSEYMVGQTLLIWSFSECMWSWSLWLTFSTEWSNQKSSGGGQAPYPLTGSVRCRADFGGLNDLQDMTFFLLWSQRKILIRMAATRSASLPFQTGVSCEREWYQSLSRPHSWVCFSLSRSNSIIWHELGKTSCYLGSVAFMRKTTEF